MLAHIGKPVPRHGVVAVLPIGGPARRSRCPKLRRLCPRMATRHANWDAASSSTGTASDFDSVQRGDRCAHGPHREAAEGITRKGGAKLHVDAPSAQTPSQQVFFPSWEEIVSGLTRECRSTRGAAGQLRNRNAAVTLA